MTNPFDDAVDEGYNPFAGGYNAPAPTPVAAAPAPVYTPAPVAAALAPAPSRGFGGAVTDKISAMSGPTYRDPVSGMPITEADLETRERVLAEKERMIAEKENAVATGNIPATRKNFPPYLCWWAYHPDEDIPEHGRKMAKIIFWVFLAAGPVYLVNLIGCFACLGNQGGTSTSVGLLIALSLVYFVILWPLSFEVCYFVFYDALVQAKGLKFVCALVMYAIWFLILVFNIIGMTDGGSVGFIIMLDLFGEGHTAVGMIAVVFVILAMGEAGVMGWMFVLLIKWYRTEGLQKKAFADLGKLAAEQAAEHPDVVMGAARTAYG